MSRKPTYLFAAILIASLFLHGCQSSSSGKGQSQAAATDSTNRTLNDTAMTKEESKDTSGTTKAIPGNDSSTLQSAAKAHTPRPLTIVIKNLASATAQVVMSIYRPHDKFPDKKGQMKEYRFTPTGTVLKVELPGLEYGEYAIASYQDLKNHGDISTNLIGIPTDPIAFSNNYRPTIHAPKFADCKFVYDEANHLITMNMIRLAK